MVFHRVLGQNPGHPIVLVIISMVRMASPTLDEGAYIIMMMMMIKLPILTCVEKPEA